ncbi:hypothetical protein BGW36DRAFT_423493 [Talaromyces proteolyticus]|uniref:Uncharacterized protein n=1 Tax=Talaromyces proteolyticus TaxID=1131652 RepID=A0AAD4Q563_9EURO|nr:uncharacterized protein BGW36DRAFT_423493 [Talaromyces proteolyticus]KAH8703956.1 hypothetical protein BGW36DRAFT_423493 [Talaromyces proteolyticus]
MAYTALTYGSLLAWISVMRSVESQFALGPPYNLSAAGVGLLNLAPFIGMLIATLIFLASGILLILMFSALSDLSHTSETKGAYPLFTAIHWIAVATSTRVGRLDTNT